MPGAAGQAAFLQVYLDCPLVSALRYVRHEIMQVEAVLVRTTLLLAAMP
jgi:hypothetical protein